MTNKEALRHAIGACESIVFEYSDVTDHNAETTFSWSDVIDRLITMMEAD